VPGGVKQRCRLSVAHEELVYERLSSPHQHCPGFIDSEPLGLNDFDLQILDILVVQVKPAL
jgi:hypothetical protein